MAKINKNVNGTVNEAEEKEEMNMEKQIPEKNEEKKEETTAVAEVKPGAPAENSEEETPKEGLGKRIWNKVKKPLAIVGGVAAGAAALVAAVKIGEAKGFDKACDNFSNLASGGDDDEEDLQDISEEIDALGESES